MSKFKYTCPTERGYERVKLSGDEYKRIFGRKRTNNLFVTRNIYKKNNMYLCENYTNKVGTIIELFLNIPFLLWDGGIKKIVSNFAKLPKKFNALQNGDYYENHREIKQES